jgi:hypothetical protein
MEFGILVFVFLPDFVGVLEAMFLFDTITNSSYSKWPHLFVLPSTLSVQQGIRKMIRYLYVAVGIFVRNRQQAASSAKMRWWKSCMLRLHVINILGRYPNSNSLKYNHKCAALLCIKTYQRRLYSESS